MTRYDLLQTLEMIFPNKEEKELKELKYETT